MSSSSELPPLFDEFPPVSTEAWMAKIREDLGASDPDAVLEWDSIDGISLPAFGRREDWAPLPHVSESASAPPLAGDASVADAWRVRVDLRHPDLDTAAGLADLGCEGEVADLGLRLGAGAGSASALSINRPADLRTLLANVPLDETNLHLERGPGALVLLSLLRTAYDRPLSALLGRGTLAYDPVGTLATGRLPDAATAFDGLETVLDEGLSDDIRSLHVDLRPYHNAGASAVQELACGLGALSDILAHLLDRGRDLSALLPRLHVTTAASTSYFVEIAKLRALRLLIPQVIGGFADAAGTSVEYAPTDVLLQVETSPRSETLYDPHVNLLRTTTEAMAAVLGGCDVLTVRPFDSRHRASERFGLRIARNVQLILRHEAHFDVVADPAAGSYYVETATHTLAERAWKRFQSLETHGGLLDALREERVQAAIAEGREQRRDAVDRRDRVLVGTNHYPNLSETRLNEWSNSTCNNGSEAGAEIDIAPSIASLDAALRHGHSAPDLIQHFHPESPPFPPLPTTRIADGIERLRLRTERYASEHHRPVVVLAPLGLPGPRSARATFALHALGVAGFDVREHLEFKAPEDAVAAAADAEGDLLVCCSADAEYPDLVPALRAALSERTPAPLLGVAGDPDQIPGSVSADVFVHRGRPLHDMLASIQRRLGIPSDEDSA
jgi:methylmalonyl-CoA mutase